MTELSNHRTAFVTGGMRKALGRSSPAYRALPWIMGFILVGPSGALPAAELAWTENRVSAAVYPQGDEVLVSYKRTALDPPVPPGALVTRVYASRSYVGGVQVDTRLCWRAPQGPCIPFAGPQLNTHRFDGLSAQGPFVLVHRVGKSAHGATPVFVSGTVTVWFAPPAMAPAHDPD